MIIFIWPSKKKKKSFKYALQSFILQYPVSSASAEEGSPASEGLEGWIKYRKYKTVPTLRNFKSQEKQMGNEKQSSDEVVYKQNMSRLSCH